MKIPVLLSMLSAAVPMAASADVIKCSFTEPFVSMTYSMTLSQLEMVTPEGTETVDNISFQILGPAKFELWDADNKPVVTLALDNAGSDGMSDTVYPYSAKWLGAEAETGGQGGGCWSNHQPRVGGETGE